MLRYLYLPFLFACGAEEEPAKTEPTQEPTQEPSSATEPIDQDEDGFTIADGDCDDSNPDINPDEIEIPGDGIDNDCDGEDAEIVLELAEGDLIITEIMYNPSIIIPQKGQWLEIYNTTDSPLELSGLRIENAQGDSFIVSSVTIQSQDVVTFGNGGNPSTNGGIVHDFVYNYSTFTFDQELRIMLQDQLIDHVDYGHEFFPVTNGQALSLTDEHFDHLENDNGFYWCAAENIMSSGDYGSPDIINSTCPPLGPDADGDGYPSIEDGGLDCDDNNPHISPVQIDRSNLNDHDQTA